jgi:RNA polymerase sigma factor (TIGR02999 family)
MWVVLQSSPNVLSDLLQRWKAGDQGALEALVPLVYGELRIIARRYLRHERPGHTLQSAALVHEAYLQLMKQGTHEFENRAHFFAISAQLMRQVLVEYARRKKAVKRDGGAPITLGDGVVLPEIQNVDIIALDEALKVLARLDARQSRIVELRFFSGLSVEEVSTILGISTATVKREWATAKVWPPLPISVRPCCPYRSQS